MTRLAPLVAAFALTALSACTSAAPPMSDPMPPSSSTPAPSPDPDAGACNADAASAGAIGKTADAATVERAKTQAGAKYARVIKPGMMVTMEFNPDRLNIDVDDKNVITNVRCG